MLITGLSGIFSPSGPSGRLTILIFHRVLPAPDPMFPEDPDVARFDQILSWVGAAFNVIPLDDAIKRLQQGQLPARALAITFDDGYADNCTLALPLLQKHGMSACFFVASGFLNGGIMWNDVVIESIRGNKAGELDLSTLGLGAFRLGNAQDKRQAIDVLLPRLKYLDSAARLDKVRAISELSGADLPDNLMMTTAQVRVLRESGMVVGGHTLNHPILARLDDNTARNEIALNKTHLESILGESVSVFAYPNGKPGRDYDARHVQMVREAGFSAAVSTSPGVSRSSSDLWQLPRFTPWDRTRLKFGLRLVRNMRSSVGVAT